jgi:hypothetical protein
MYYDNGKNIYINNIHPLDKPQSTLLEHFNAPAPTHSMYPNSGCKNQKDECICTISPKPTPTTAPKCATILVPTQCPVMPIPPFPTPNPTPHTTPKPTPHPGSPKCTDTTNIKDYKHHADVSKYISSGDAFVYEDGKMKINPNKIGGNSIEPFSQHEHHHHHHHHDDNPVHSWNDPKMKLSTVANPVVGENEFSDPKLTHYDMATATLGESPGENKIGQAFAHYNDSTDSTYAGDQWDTGDEQKNADPEPGWNVPVNKSDTDGKCSECSWTWSSKCLPTCLTYQNIDMDNIEKNMKKFQSILPGKQGSPPYLINVNKTETGTYDLYLVLSSYKIIQLQTDKKGICKKTFQYHNKVDGYDDTISTFEEGNSEYIKSILKKISGSAIHSVSESAIAHLEQANLILHTSRRNLNNPRVSDAIQNKLMGETNRWSDIVRKNTFLYNTKTAIGAAKYSELQHTNSQLQNQLNKLNGINNSNDTITKNIYSSQRQVEIANDAARRRTQNIFLLKLLFTYVFIMCIPLMMGSFFSDRFNSTNTVLLMIFISLPFVYILYKNLRSIRSRSAIRWPLRNWARGPLPKSQKPTPAPTCPPPELPCSPEAEHNLEVLEQEIKDVQRLENQLNRGKNILNRIENKLEQGLCKDYKNCPKKNKYGIPIRGCDTINITNDTSKWKW